MHAARGSIPSSNRFLRVSEVSERYGASVNTIWRWAKRHPDFPKPVKLGPGITAWRLSDLEAFESQREALR